MAHFTLKQLEIFIAVAKYSSVSDAARVLHLTQPAISQQIRKIELYSNQSLFNQIGRKIYLTDKGKLLLKHAKNVIEQVDIFKTACTADDGMNGKLKLGVGIPLQTMFFNIFSKFNLQHSLAQVEFLDGDRNAQLECLNENKIDFCLMVHPVTRIKLICELITELPMSFIISPHHPLADKKNIPLQSLANETFIICEEGSANYNKIHELFAKLNSSSPKLIQIKDQNAVKYAVMANLGISVLPNYMLQLELKHNLLIPLTVDEFTNPVTAAYWVQHADKILSPLVTLFKTFLFNEIRQAC